MEFKVEIDGVPVPKGRPRWSKHGTYTPKKTKDHETYIQQCWDSAYGNLKPSDKPLSVMIAFYMPIPKSTPKKTRKLILEGGYWHTKKPDMDNLVKSVLDGLNKAAYIDDSQIVFLSTKKEYSETPKTVVWVQEVE
ncbi:RusA family crossover junction endodeoxyribonuclease [Anaerotignum sp. MB30-C6]|uniref:RusA family crossover junction endodeoxyribonuclease n=1 Tax=Anaerotignum sp. MB30-C6 TaxID=3070814 RepID=UPI0027DBF22B|nr:RusA family crossover junction endodeoxyribonuclease [Anaerotignum sp. MB30-C6]WMI81813.1 RusA family crossover junction endodeoxyribonuclease [Anaerotignum sp. MB30-C6]